MIVALYKFAVTLYCVTLFFDWLAIGGLIIYRVALYKLQLKIAITVLELKGVWLQLGRALNDCLIVLLSSTEDD